MYINLDNINEIIQQIDDLQKSSIFEASRLRPDILKEIDLDFGNIKTILKKTPIDKKKLKEYVIKLCDHIKQFTQIKRVYFKIVKKEYNAGVIVLYNRSLPIDFLDNLKESLKSKEIKLQQYNEDEVAKYIDTIYIFFGDDLLNNCIPREATSVLLHELGHIYEHTSNFPRVFTIILANYLSKYRFSVINTGILALLLTASNIAITVLVPIILIFLVLSRSLFYTQHLEEYNADSYPTKYGYGDDHIRLFNKEMIQSKKSKYNKVGFFTKLINSFYLFFVPSTHPSEITRVCNIGTQMKTDYANMYPKISKDIKIVLSDLKC